MWWAHVTDKPLESKITVLSNGTEYTERAVIPFGGHTIPNSTEGDKEASKKAQKKETKKKTSDKIKNSILTRSLSSNLWLWKPIILSRCTSFHQRNIIKTKTKKGIKNLVKSSFKLINSIKLDIVENKIREIRRGQKDLCTAKKGLVYTLKFINKRFLMADYENGI